MQIPVALFVYRRPETLRQVLDCLRADEIPLLYVFSDGPKQASVEDDVRSVRALARSIDWCRCIVVERRSNYGLGTSIIDGVTTVLSRHGSAIVYEDDLVSVPGTYHYLCEALRIYENDQRVMSVTGWTHPRIVPADVEEGPYFDGKGECWIWGTWARSWSGMNRPVLQIMRECVEAGIDIDRYGSDMPKMAIEAGPKNLWAVGWWYHHMLHGGLCLRPPWSMCEQICWDRDLSTTATPEMMEWMNPPLRQCPSLPVTWPEPIEHPDCARVWRAAAEKEDLGQ